MLAKWIVSWLRVSCLLGVMFGMFGPSTLSVHAAGLELDPAWQEVFLAENQTATTGSLTIKNRQDQPISIELWPIDAVIDASGNLSLTPVVSTAAAQAVSRLVRLQQDRLVIPAQDEVTVPWQVENRLSLSPGGHYAAVAVREPVASLSAQTNVIMPALLSWLVVHKQGGERWHLALTQMTNFSWWQWQVPHQVQLTFRNDGNVHVIPRGEVILVDGRGQIVRKGVVNTTSTYVFPGTQRRLNVDLRPIASSWPIMFYTLRATGQAVTGPNLTWQQDTSFVVVDWRWLGGGLGVAVLGLMMVRKFGRRAHHRISPLQAVFRRVQGLSSPGKNKEQSS